MASSAPHAPRLKWTRRWGFQMPEYPPRAPSGPGGPQRLGGHFNLNLQVTRLQSNIRAAHPQKANSALSSDSQRSRPSRTGITSLLQFLRCSLAPSRFVSANYTPPGAAPRCAAAFSASASAVSSASWNESSSSKADPPIGTSASCDLSFRMRCERKSQRRSCTCGGPCALALESGKAAAVPACGGAMKTVQRRHRLTGANKGQTTQEATRQIAQNRDRSRRCDILVRAWHTPTEAAGCAHSAALFEQCAGSARVPP